MLVWTRAGIVALIVPVVIIVASMAVASALKSEVPRPEPRVRVAVNPDDGPTEKDIDDLKAARKDRETEQRRQAQGARQTGFVVACFVSAAALWPLGRWMNRREARSYLDESTEEAVTVHSGGGHTFFFIPVEYWSLLWVACGLYNLFGKG